MREQIEAVERRIEAAARRAGRTPAEVTLIAVTKTFPASVIREAYDAGLRVFGENYIQEFERKRPELEGLPGAKYHFIGHLQSNKARRAVELFDAIETVDSAKLARRIDEAAGRELETMIEVKLSGEQAKSGVAPEDLPALVEEIRDCQNLRLTGLMTMPPWSDDPERSRPYFRRLSKLAEQCGLPNLSMGMSHDLEVAIEEGATHVRVGTALFGSRKRA